MYKTLQYLTFILLITNSLFIQSTLLGVALTTIYVLVFGYLLGQLLFKKLEDWEQLIFGAFSLLSIFALTLTPLFYTYNLSKPVILILLTVVSSIILFKTYSYKFILDRYIFTVNKEITLLTIAYYTALIFSFLNSTPVLWGKIKNINKTGKIKASIIKYL